MQNTFDCIVVGGALVGSAVACGLLSRGYSVGILDGSDSDFRASRGNFGLAWVQGKGADFASYALWTSEAARNWPDFADYLRAETGVDIGLQQDGGLDFCVTEKEFSQRREKLQRVQQNTNGQFTFDMLDNRQLRELVPEVSADVTGASFSHHDGHLNPLLLLRALHVRVAQLGGHYFNNSKVLDIQVDNPESAEPAFRVVTAQHTYHCAKVILCAGLANATLCHSLAMDVPVHANQGQLLITERLKPFLKYPSIHVRQTGEGTLQIGDSHAEVGMDDSTTLSVLAGIASRLVRIFPHLDNVNVVRTWSALRIMTPDGYPVYEASARFKNAYAVNCHSGVTLAPLHAGPLCDWIDGQPTNPVLGDFSANRFHASNRYNN